MLLERAAQTHRSALEGGSSPATLLAYGQAHKQFIAFVASVAGEAPTTQHMTLQMGRDWQSDMRRRGLSTTTIGNYTRVVRAWAKQLVADETLPSDPFLHLKAPKAALRVPNVLTPAQIRLLVDLASTTHHPERDRALVLILADSGVRNDELCGLRLADLEPAVRDRPGRLFVSHGKGDKQRFVGIGQETSRSIKAYLRDVRGIDLDQPRKTRRVDTQPWLFLTRGWQQITTDAVRGLFRLLAVRAGLPPELHIHPHGLRHTFGTLQAKAGTNAFALQAQLGHASVVQSQRYVTLSEQDIGETYSSLVDGIKPGRVQNRGNPRGQSH